jgi:hypothetical protein
MGWMGLLLTNFVTPSFIQEGSEADWGQLIGRFRTCPDVASQMVLEIMPAQHEPFARMIADQSFQHMITSMRESSELPVSRQLEAATVTEVKESPPSKRRNTVPYSVDGSTSIPRTSATEHLPSLLLTTALNSRVDTISSTHPISTKDTEERLAEVYHKPSLTPTNSPSAMLRTRSSSTAATSTTRKPWSASFPKAGCTSSGLVATVLSTKPSISASSTKPSTPASSMSDRTASDGSSIIRQPKVQRLPYIPWENNSCSLDTVLFLLLHLCIQSPTILSEVNSDIAVIIRGHFQKLGENWINWTVPALGEMKRVVRMEVETHWYKITHRSSVMDLLTRTIGYETWTLELRQRLYCSKGHFFPGETKSVQNYWRFGYQSGNMSTQQMMTDMVCHASTLFSQIDRELFRGLEGPIQTEGMPLL